METNSTASVKSKKRVASKVEGAVDVDALTAKMTEMQAVLDRHGVIIQQASAVLQKSGKKARLLEEDDEDRPKSKTKKKQLLDESEMAVLTARLKEIDDPAERAEAVKRAIKRAKSRAEDLDIEIDDFHIVSNTEFLVAGLLAAGAVATAWYLGDRHGQRKVHREHERANRLELSNDEREMVRAHRMKGDNNNDDMPMLLAEYTPAR